MTQATELSSLAVDTCILLEVTDAARIHHLAAREVLELHSLLVLPSQVIREYLVVATRPVPNNGLGLSLSAARANVQAFLANMRLLPEEQPVLPAFFGLLDHAPCVGKRIHDAHLAATAMAHGVVEILTLNGRDFSAFAPHVRVITPVEVLAIISSMKTI